MPTNLSDQISIISALQPRPDGTIVTSDLGGGTPPSGGGEISSFPYDSTREVITGAYHVDPVSGSDSNDGILVAEGGSGPWKTINPNLSTLDAGDTLYLREGTHLVTLLDTKFGFNNGTALNKIEITSYPGEEPVIDCQGTNWLDRFDGKDYWRFSYFKIIDYVSAIEIGEDISSNRVELYSILGETEYGGDNVGLVRILNCSDFDIDRVKTGYTGASQPHLNTGGIYINNPSSNSSGTINRYETDGFPIGLYFKHGDSSVSSHTGVVTVSNSFISSTTRNALGYNIAGVLLDNVIFTEEVVINEDDGGAAGDWNRFDHCTFYGGVNFTNAQGGADNNRLTNCIVMSRMRVGQSSSITTDSDHNLFAPNIIQHSFVDSPQSYTSATLAQWRAFNSSDANSVEGAPTFVSGTPTAIADFALDTGSNGENAASDGSDIGADVTQIGVAA